MAEEGIPDVPADAAQHNQTSDPPRNDDPHPEAVEIPCETRQDQARHAADEVECGVPSRKKEQSHGQGQHVHTSTINMLQSVFAHFKPKNTIKPSRFRGKQSTSIK